MSGIEPAPGVVLFNSRERRIVRLVRPATVEKCFGRFSPDDPDSTADESLWWIAKDTRLKIKTFVSLDDPWVEADAITQLGALE